MNVITEPSVAVISRPIFQPHWKYELPAHHVAAENIIATAGKVCYDSYGPEGNPVDKHVKSLVDSGHHSVLEHVHIGVFIEGISRGCSHEIVRHRMFNYSQRSTRYTTEEGAAIVLDPYYTLLWERDKTNEVGKGERLTSAEDNLLSDFLECCEHSIDAYKVQVALLEQLNPAQLTGRDLRKWCRGKARQLLPHALETRMVMTGNLRAWRHFFVMRSSRHAEAEIRRLAEVLFYNITRFAPTAFADLKGEQVGDYMEWSV